MKGENYLYFNGHTAEPAADDRAMMIPASTVRGIAIGAIAGTVDLDAIYLTCEGFVGDGASRGSVVLAVTAGNLVEGLKDGDTIYYDKHAGHDISWKDTLYRVIRDGDVVLLD